MWKWQKKKFISQYVAWQIFYFKHVLKCKNARKINEIIFWFIIEAEIGKKWADSEKNGFSREKKITYHQKIKIFQNAFNTSLE